MRKSPPSFFIVGERYHDRNGEYVVTSVGGDNITFEQGGRQYSANAQTKATIHRNILSEKNSASAPKPPNRPKKPKTSGDPGILTDIFPVVVEIIEGYSKQTAAYMTHHLIVEALLQHHYALPILTQHSLEGSERLSPKDFASNHVAHYGKVWTQGRPWHADRLERKKVEGRWAYRVSP